MKAPLPEVPPLDPKRRDFAKEPFRGLNVICATQAFLALAAIPLHAPSPELSPFWNWAFPLIATGLELLLTYYLWRGFGWARGVWLWLTILFLPFYFLPEETIQYSFGQQLLWNLSYAFSLFTLVWLNLPDVKAHFARRKIGEETVKLS